MKNNYWLLFCVLLLSAQKISAQAPSVSSLYPNAGPVGAVITISGSNLNDSTSISIGGQPALILSNNGTQLAAMVMPGSASGKLIISTRSGADSSEAFTVTVSKPPVSQLQKLTGTGGVLNTDIGMATAISADNNTIALGGPADSMAKGAVWIYTRDTGGLWLQQGNKLVPDDASATAQIGQKLAISADGKTLITGGMLDNESTGAAWIFVKDTDGNWVQQAKLVGTGAVGAAKQGCAVAISADGNTAVIGGYADSATLLTLGVGAVWVFVRDSNNVWKQQGTKLIGNGAAGSAAQGTAVAISADGSTILSGGIADSNAVGAVWVFVKDANNVWKQQRSKLRITNANHPLSFGFSVALSADGNTAIIGSDDSFDVFGGAWIFVRNNKGIWSQQGNKLVGTDPAYTGGRTEQGRSVAISADGNTAISGGYGNNFGEGGAWIFTRKNSKWSQYGNKLLGSNVAGANAQQGYSVSISAGGNIALLGGPSDDFGNGAGWVFADSSFVLPVAISSFQAYLSGKGVQTVWKTYSEVNSSYYVVERSANGRAFEEKYSLPVKAITGENSYSWFDPSPLYGDNYYRLKMVDKNGATRYSAIVKITTGIAVTGSINVYPNPGIDKSFYIQLNNLPAGDYSMAVYSSTGKKVYTTYVHHIGSEAVRVKLSNASAGIYYVEVSDNKHQYKTKVLIR